MTWHTVKAPHIGTPKGPKKSIKPAKSHGTHTFRNKVGKIITSHPRRKK